MGKRHRRRTRATEPDIDQRLADRVVQAAYATLRPGPRADALIADLSTAAESPDAFEPFAVALVTAIDRAADGCVGRGWQPEEIVHAVGRVLRAPHRRVCSDVLVAGDDDGRAAPRLLTTWCAALGGVVEAVRVAVTVTGVLHQLPKMPAPTSPRATGRESPVLTKVRALLAKAESTDFPAEADALTAKAQELIARHAIDTAQIGVGPEASSGDVVWRRTLIDDPYVNAKSSLLGVIGKANRCRSVYDPQFAIVTTFGTESDLDAVELLFASLLTQATHAMTAAGTSARTRTRGFRNAFMLSYAQRIGERLRQTTEEVVAEAGADYLPILASRDAAVREAVEREFPHARMHRGTVSDGAGWAAGRVAADLAQIGTGAALGSAALGSPA